MTDYFEVHERDAAARLGELRLAESVTTPALVGDVDADTPDAVHTLLRDGGSLWAQDNPTPEGDDSAVTVLPYRGLPAGTPDEVADAFAGDYPDIEFPSAAVVSPQTAGQHPADVTVLSGAPGYVGHGEAFVGAVTAVREATPSDTALYLPGVATPRNVATLVYAGVDLVDPDRAVVRGTEGRYLTTDEAYFLEDLEELPCACPACQVPRDEFDPQDCVEHNVNALAAELRRVRRRVRDGRLRDYVEGQARQDNWLTATVRLLDQQYGYVEQRTPLIRRAQLSAATEDAIRRVEIQRFAERVTERYVPRFDDRPLVLVPCSARKPYSDSQSHEQYHDAVHWRAHMVSMTSPIGVVPQELELTYPAQHYDSVVTGNWSANEIEFVSTVLERYLEDADYPEIIAHVPGEGYRDICERVEASLGLEFTYTVADHPTTADSLGNLAAELEGWDTYRKSTREANTVRAVADYQFGEGAGDALFDDIQTAGRYPQLRADSPDGEQLAALAQQYGVLSLTVAGARRWIESDVPAKVVDIEPFVPHGSVLAPGITDASDDIRVGDDVIVRGDAAFGVGRAQMSGPEMRDSTRGIAVQMRHVEEQ
ncbi:MULTISPECIES: archaeosine synthase subunit alpha [Haloarcula]|uniref:archaeosine synthase subunit alpha n=1 Tax=Haloarcula TaxID=2237 RepID=UPI0023EDB2ED|nr:archaeosine synthase subunit alpha [Halomicroarcula sp. XH51]